MSTNPYDGTAAQCVPLSVEKLPLYHWRPGTRALVVGSRDGVAFATHLEAQDGTSFRRPVARDLLAEAAQRGGCRALAVAYGATWRYPRACGEVLAAAHACGLPLLAACNGQGDPAVGRALASGAAAIVAAVTADDQAGADALMTVLDGCAVHVEWLVGVPPDGRLPGVRWQRGSAAHLVPLRAADGLDGGAIRLPIPTYHDRAQRTICVCGEVVVWRAAGRVRIDGDGRTCPACARPLPLSR